MNRIYSLLLFLFIALPGFSQSSPVVLSYFKGMDVMDPSTNELNNFMIELTVSAPASLNRLEITMEEPDGMITTPVLVLPIIVKENKAAVDFNKFAIAFQGQRVMFALKVRDQLSAPFRRILVKGIDAQGKETNQVVFTRIN